MLQCSSKMLWREAYEGSSWRIRIWGARGMIKGRWKNKFLLRLSFLRSKILRNKIERKREKKLG